MATATKKTAPKTPEFTGKYTYAVGKRKTSIARVKVYKGAGKFFINGCEAKKYFSIGYASFVAPIQVVGAVQKDFDIDIKVLGGGINSQAEACRHGLSKVLEIEDEARRAELKKAGFLTRDSRVKERKKPGLRRARRAPQWSKR